MMPVSSIAPPSKELIAVLQRRVIDFADRQYSFACEALSELQCRVTSSPVIYARPDQFCITPFFVPESLWQVVRRATLLFLRLLRREMIRILKMGIPYATNLLGIPRTDRDLALLSRRSHAAACLARPDLLVTATGLSFLETNIDSSLGGLGTADPLNFVYKQNAFVQAVVRPYEYQYKPIVPAFRQMVLRSLSLIKTPAPTLGIVDWSDEISSVPWPYERLAEDLGRLGLPCVLANETDLEYRQGFLWAKGSKIDVVYRGITADLRLRRTANKFDQLWRAHADDAVSVISSFWSTFYSSKAMLSVLSEAADNGCLSTSESRFLNSILPWTRRVEARKLRVGGNTVDLLPFLRAHKDDFVLKGTCDGSSKSVVVGRSCSGAEWVSALNNACYEPTIVQRMVEPPTVEQLVIDGTMLKTEVVRWNLSPFYVGGTTAGSCYRSVTSTAEEYRISCTLGARESIAVVLGGI
jgi:hypothetical protein